MWLHEAPTTMRLGARREAAGSEVLRQQRPGWATTEEAAQGYGPTRERTVSGSVINGTVTRRDNDDDDDNETHDEEGGEGGGRGGTVPESRIALPRALCNG